MLNMYATSREILKNLLTHKAISTRHVWFHPSKFGRSVLTVPPELKEQFEVKLHRKLTSQFVTL